MIVLLEPTAGTVPQSTILQYTGLPIYRSVAANLEISKFFPAMLSLSFHHQLQRQRPVVLTGTAAGAVLPQRQQRHRALRDLIRPPNLGPAHLHPHALQHIFRLRHNVGPANLRQQRPNTQPRPGLLM